MICCAGTENALVVVADRKLKACNNGICRSIVGLVSLW